MPPRLHPPRVASPGVGVFVVTAVVQQLHHGLLGGERMRKAWGEAVEKRSTSPLQGCLWLGGRLTLEVLARSCCSSRGDVRVGMRHSGDRFSFFCWGRSGKWLRAYQEVLHALT